MLISLLGLDMFKGIKDDVTSSRWLVLNKSDIKGDMLFEYMYYHFAPFMCARALHQLEALTCIYKIT